MSRWMIALAAVVGLLMFHSASQVRAEDAGGKGKIEGKVVGLDGKPAANVKVRLMAARERGAKKDAAKLEAGEKPAKGNRPQPLAETTTNAEGAFIFADVAPGEYSIGAGERGAGMGRTKVTVTAGGTINASIKLEQRAAKEKKPAA